MRALIEETPLVIYAKDEALRFTLSNRMHASLIGRAPPEILGRTDTDLFGADAEVIEAQSAQVLATGDPNASEYTLPIAGEVRTYLETIFPLRSSTGELLGLGGIATDITARRALERALAQRATELQQTVEALERTRAELVQKEKMAALGGLVAGVAHEVNTPLGVALTSCTMLADELALLDRALTSETLTRDELAARIRDGREAMRLAIDGLERAGRLVMSFKQVAVDRQASLVRTMPFGTWLRDLVTSLAPLGRKRRVRIVSQVEGDRALTFAASELQQVLTNLLINAFDHAFRGLDRDRLVHILARLNDDALILSVADNGQGMSDDIAARVYEPFFTTSRAEGGSGLGMHIVFNLVTSLFGGRIDLETAPGEGTRWTVTLPLPTDVLHLPRRSP
jgi:PAS domain S-box-containing protein